MEGKWNISLLRIVYYTDSLYNIDEDHFMQQVVGAERQIYEQEKMHRLAGEKKKGKENKKAELNEIIQTLY